jgi:hypothetical protein
MQGEYDDCEGGSENTLRRGFSAGLVRPALRNSFRFFHFSDQGIWLPLPLEALF